MATTQRDDSIPPEAGSDETHVSIVEQPETTVSPLALSGEPETDKAFVTAGGTRFRARIVTIARQETAAPVNGTVDVAVSGLNLSLTLAVLDDQMNVARDANGALLISDVHEIVWGDVAFSNPDFDPATALDAILRQQAFILETRMAKRAALVDVLAQWGGAPMMPTSPDLTLMPATSAARLGHDGVMVEMPVEQA